jgi:uncharacterized delta-60 repeat protein
MAHFVLGVESAAVTTGARRLRANAAAYGPLAFALALLAALLAPALAEGKPGDLDRSFGDGGKVVTNFCTHARFFSVAIDRHGRAVVAGTDNGASQFCLARFRGNGSFDRSFSGDGKVTTDFGDYAGARSVAIDSRGRIVAAGAYGLSPRDLNGMALARYKPNGTLDDSLSGDGMVKIALGGPHDIAQSVAIAPHDRIIAAGRSGRDFALVRLRQNGSLDGSFGTGGVVTTDFGDNDVAYSLAIDSQRRIVAGGATRGRFSALFAVARYEPNGALDRSFSHNGKVQAFGSTDGARSVGIDSHDRVVAVGRYAPKRSFALARYARNGRRDHSFGDGGQVTTRFADDAGANSVAIDRRGRIVAAGGGFDLARYKPNGRRDPTFSGNGKVSTGWGAIANSLAIDHRDRLVVTGWHSHLVLARFIG